ncbi:Serine/threonine-protein kinase/endoribonuclease ire-1 [Holothuria leucospilota]|uniref:Serine/threonine-protein kinase/endoribonuclease ire-1 n=1 Tax=Holothuria leucospilota TaxID=206669 RepID=A0A9Q0YE11_HOLLE|nr:Serine/threonine-protein kinase/endoribonuclease ire-1 [Holothuria leucospilota]
MPTDASDRGKTRTSPQADTDIPTDISSRDKNRSQDKADTDIPTDISSRDKNRSQDKADTDMPTDASDRGKTRTSPQADTNGRWDSLLHDCKTKKGTKKVGSIEFNKDCTLATGSFGAQIYVGYRGSQEVAVKRVCTEFIRGELKVINSLKDKSLKNVLQPVCCFSDDDFTYIVTPLCEYNLEELIEDKSCPLRKLSKRPTEY